LNYEIKFFEQVISPATTAILECWASSPKLGLFSSFIKTGLFVVWTNLWKFQE